MTAIFISQPISDDAGALKNRLGEQGREQLFLDFDPADGIPASVARGSGSVGTCGAAGPR
jgi:hypothetical protein